MGTWKGLCLHRGGAFCASDAGRCEKQSSSIQWTIMVLIRLLHPLQFDSRQGRFSSGAFCNSSGSVGGISVIDFVCATRELAFCQYIAKHYGERIKEPCFFWKFEFDDLTAAPGADPPELVGDASRGDPCHLNIHKLRDGRAGTLFKNATAVSTDAIGICRDGKAEPYSKEVAIAMVHQAHQRYS